MRGAATLIQQHFVKLADPRSDICKKHPLLHMIFMALSAAICGADNWADVERFVKAKRDWFAKYLDLSSGVPSHDTFGRVFARLDTAQFLTAMQAWMQTFAGNLRGQGVAIDGKVLRGSFDRAAGQSALGTLTAFATKTRLCLRQHAIADGSNEIPAAVELLEMLDLAGAVITADALHCQIDTVQAIVNREADYVLTVKGNQEKLRDVIAELFQADIEGTKPLQGKREFTTVDDKHGRKERRTYIVAPAPNHPVLRKWPGLKTIGVVVREREVGEKFSDEVTYLISSLPARVKRISRFVRDHWLIECQHYQLDVVFTEDASRIRKGSGPEVAGAFRRMALNILQQDTSVKDNVRGKRKRVGWDESLLDAIYAGITR